MPSTLYRPRQHPAASVVDLDAARARLRGTSQRTFLVRCATVLVDEPVTRHIGIHSDAQLDEVQRVLEISFAVPDGPPSPARFTAHRGDSGRLAADSKLSVHLHEPGDELYYHWGLWDFTLTLTDVCPRDAATPRALCVAGNGAFVAGEPLDIPEINAQLLGPTAIEDVLAGAREEVVDLVERSHTMDFIPLLQAMDLPRGAEVSAATASTLDTLPRERDLRSRDAFWCTVLALSCLAERPTTDDVVESAMAALGWEDGGGGPLSAAQIEELCSGSLVRLASVGGYGAGGKSAVDKLDLYRALLRRAN